MMQPRFVALCGTHEQKIGREKGRQEVYDEFLKLAAEMKSVIPVYPGQTYSSGMGTFIEHLVTEIKQRLS